MRKASSTQASAAWSCDGDIFTKYDDSTCLSWKEVLSLVDKYHKVNSLLVDNANYFDESFILPKSLCVCVIRYIGEEGLAQGSKEEGLEQGSKKSLQCPGGSTVCQSGSTT